MAESIAIDVCTAEAHAEPTLQLHRHHNGSTHVLGARQVCGRHFTAATARLWQTEPCVDDCQFCSRCDCFCRLAVTAWAWTWTWTWTCGWYSC